MFRLALRTAIRPASRVAMRPVVMAPRRFMGAEPSSFLEVDIVKNRVIEVVSNMEKIDESKVTDDVAFADLGLDSLDSVELVMALEEEFVVTIPDAEAEKIQSTKAAIEYICSHPQAM